MQYQQTPILTMYAQQKMQVIAEAKNPDSCVTAGIARIPAPTYMDLNSNKEFSLLQQPIISNSN
jgi:hypothetical protein